MSLTRLRLLKVGAVAAHRSYWRPLLAERVLPTAEFESLPFLPGIRTILDVGANRGQFALFASRRFPEAQIHMFEPVQSAAAVARRVVPAAILHEIALGDEDGTTTFYVHPDSDQSSVLPIEGASKIHVPVARLDAIPFGLESRVLLKLDVQGFEMQVLRGAGGVLDHIDQVLCEMSREGYIRGASNQDLLLKSLKAKGFRPVAAGPLLPYGTDVLFSRRQM